MAVNTTSANNTIKTRTQLKRDTAARWAATVLVADGGTKSSGESFVPLAGELIVYLPDTTHNYSRLKVGDGSTNVVRLPFIDAGTVNGEVITNEIEYFQGTQPANGDTTKLYVDTTNNAMYYYNGTSYVKLSNLTYTFTYEAATKISNWDAGTMPTFTISGGNLTISLGTRPTLNYTNSQFLKSVTKEGES